MPEKFSPHETADFLDTEEDIRLYLEACQEDGDPKLIAMALGNIAKARNMTQLAEEAGLTRAGLYKALSPDGNPSFATVSRVAHALGLRISLQPLSQNSTSQPGT
ncbi:putative addiction module antidote protein [Methylonatrum kenyense]|uniref:addiction module antidote protein n=1 Tax=Methylonatrum kenyense TaxID=455253 RepID=UPI0020C124D6|nr:addiction module antidote protein [Methylonatrum kenyense]MCK8514991.1 putative addiction module antidote protein [Methylonatrum kenyense]